MKKPILVLDLDETTISSNHRTPRKLDGSVELHGFFDKRHPESIMRDTLLPLGKIWANLKARYTIWICTSRDMSRADYAYLEKHGLEYDKIISREQYLVNIRDAEDSQYLYLGKLKKSLRVKNSIYYEPGPTYKVKRLKQMLNLKQYQNRPVYVFDDEPKIISALRQAGFKTFNALKINRRLANVV